MPIEEAILLPHYTVRYSRSRRRWVVLDLSDGHETPCLTKQVAWELAQMCEGVRRLIVEKAEATMLEF